MRLAGIVLLHYNACLHVVLLKQQLLQQLQGSWQVFSHPACNSDLSSSAFHLFQHLKRSLVGKHFPNDDNIQTDGTHRLTPCSGGGFIRHRIQNLVLRYGTCFSFGGFYVER
ncbi:hypothetical protein AVEN_142540-1 [Araneus ventricosus]|uniref:Secreted protein n=1 Tax=Araneus ventricosus TaxID=182803 RepID=A0A4Y2CHN0_ARAVE|nr:hypothetical protein AVEN_142540-1 [Araneus ventricosus]